MNNLQLIIKNACYYAGGDFLSGHILVDGGKIIDIVDVLPPEAHAARVIDAEGKFVLPGLVDSHVHLREPGREDREDFFTGTCAAVAAGFSMVCDMPNVTPPVFNADILRQRIALAEEKCLCDVAFYGAAGYNNRDQLQQLAEAGVCAFKTFLAPPPPGRESEFMGLTVNDDGQLYMLLRAAAEIDARFSFHCENSFLISQMEHYLHEHGAEDYSFHYRSRPNVAEEQAVATIIAFAGATGVRAVIAHISTPGACELVRRARADGLDITAETCFQYLTFDDSYIDRLGPYAKCNPPLRSAADVAAMWQYVLDGTISFIGSDHAPLTREEKEIGKKEGIWRAFSGMPGMEAFTPIMLTAVNRGQLTLAQLAQLMSENVCRKYGLYPQKGCIAPGSDADFTIVDMQRRYKLSIDDMYTKSRAANLMFDGYECCGGVDYTILRGTVLCENGKVCTDLRGYGRFVPRRIK